MSTNDQRPVFLDLFRIRLPVNAVASLAHRISGILLFLSLPGAIYLLELSLRSPEDYAYVQQVLGSWPMRLAGVLLAWAFSHHLFAGVRHLLLDLDLGVGLHAARRSAASVLVLGVLGALVTTVLVIA